jgi:hypothetical protein
VVCFGRITSCADSHYLEAATWDTLRRILRIGLKECRDLSVMSDSRGMLKAIVVMNLYIFVSSGLEIQEISHDYFFLSPFQCLLKQGMYEYTCIYIYIYIYIHMNFLKNKFTFWSLSKFSYVRKVSQ